MKHRLDPFNPPNVRFWTWWNDGLVKITLKPDQRIELSRSSRDEEGWSSSAEIFTHDGDEIVSECYSDGTDCDGRSSSSSNFWAPLAAMNKRPCFHWVDLHELKRADPSIPAWHVEIPQFHEGRPMTGPEWIKGKSSQRNYSAEAAGY